MRGNRFARKFDVSKTRKQRKNELTRRLSKTGRVIRLKKRLGGIRQRKDKKSSNAHTTALMESYVMRRKAERKAERKKEEEAEEKKQLEEAKKAPLPAATPAAKAPAKTEAKKAPVNRHRLQSRSLY